jgi:hypothetical protein
VTSPESAIRRFASVALSRVVTRTIRRIQSLGRESMLSADDSGLLNVWDEVCVQCQVDQSVFWDTYVDVIDRFLNDEVCKENTEFREAMWLQTEQGEEWLREIEDLEDYSPDRRNICVVDDDVVDWARQELLERAGSWSNVRIEHYVDSQVTD